MPVVYIKEKNTSVNFPDGTPPEVMEKAIRENFYSVEEQNAMTTFKEREGYRLRKGQSIVNVGGTGWKALQGRVSNEDALKFESETMKEFTIENDERFAARNSGEKFVGATTELLPYMFSSTVESVDYGAKFAGIGALAAVIGGQLGPQILAPEEILTVPAAGLLGWKVGQAYGAWTNAARVEGGGLYLALLKENVDPKTAALWAEPAGYMIGAIELLQVGQVFNKFIPGGSRLAKKSVIDLILKNAKKGAPAGALKRFLDIGLKLITGITKRTGLETGEEAMQEVTSLFAEAGAHLNDAIAKDEETRGPSIKEAIARLKDTIIQGLLGFPLLQLPGSIVTTAAGRATGKAVTPKAQDALLDDLQSLVEEAKKFDNVDDFIKENPTNISREVVQGLGFDNHELMMEGIWDEAQREKVADEGLKEITPFEMKTLIAEAEKAGILITEKELAEFIKTVPEETIGAIREGVKALEEAPEITPEAITGIIEEVQKITEPISEELAPLSEEARKFETAEEFIESVKEKPFVVDIKSLKPGQTRKFTLQGRKKFETKTKGPITVFPNKKGQLEILDGHNRFFSALDRGDSKIEVKISRSETFAPKQQLVDIFNKAKEVPVEPALALEAEKTKITKQLELEIEETGEAEITPAIAETFEAEITPEQKVESYRQNIEIKRRKKKVTNIVKDESRKTGTSFKEFANKAFVPISTRLSKIDERLKVAMRKYEFFTNLQTKRDSEATLPFLEKYHKLSREDAATLDFALKNRDIDIVNEILERNNLVEEFNKVTELLNDIFNRAGDVGLDVNYLIDYFPRRVDDTSGFLDFIRSTENWSAIEEAIKAQEKSQGYIMDDPEKVEFINKIIRGFGATQIRLNIPSNVKNRLITRITPEMNLFYKDSSQALLDYISALNNAIESRKFFGKGKDIDESIGRYIKILIDERVISADQEKEVRDILKARFEQSGTHGVWQTYKNFSYIYAMGSPISAITQIGDQAFSLYKNGAYRTTVGVLKSILNRSEITKADLGIETIAQEFADPSRSSKAVSKVFKIIGLEWIDRVGKESLINGALNRISEKAKKNDAALKDELELVFGNQASQVMEDLKNKNLTDNVKYLMFSELADVQPIALSEMPEYYLNGGNLRIFYMLKTYTLKLIDIYHNDVFVQMKTDPKKGLKNLIKLTASVALMGATSDVIKDLLLGRDIEFDDLIIDNLLKLFGFNRWQLYKARQDGLLTAFMRSILPPVPFLDDVYKDIVNRRKFPDWRIIGRIPFVGKFYYWWFGGGKRFRKRGKKKGVKFPG